MRFETKAVLAGQEPDPRTGSVTVPIYQTSTFKQDGIGVLRDGNEYSRSGNPTRRALETSIAALEGAGHGLAFGSGLAAEAAVLQALLKPGDHVAAASDIYGGTYRLLEKIFSGWRITTDFADIEKPESFRKIIRPETKIVWIESISNPLLKVADVREISKIARERGALTVVDNTFASPFLFKPLEHGADIVVHSSTKYISGHSQIIGGLVALNDSALYDKIKFIQNGVGAVPGPLDCWLTLLGVKTLPLRMDRHNLNALSLAKFLSKHPKVEKVYYPGLSKEKTAAAKKFGGFGGVVSFEIKGGQPEAERFFSGLKIITLAESLGAAETLISYPWAMSHGSLPPERKLKFGITAGLIRLSTGIENWHDLKQDLANGLKRI
jgi:cystathionine beta-lyase/cystathionine gamma-synthase